MDVYLNVHPVSFLRFLEQASNTWHSVGLQISMTLRPNQQLPLEAYRHLDRIHFMTYDMITKQGQHHAEMENVKKAVLQILSQGCPPEKLLLGIPAYSRHATRPENVQTFAEIYDAVNGDLTALKRGELAGYQFDTLEHVRQKMQFAYDQNLRGVFFWELGQDKQQPPTAGGVLLETAAGKRNELLVSGNKNQDRDEL